MNTVECNKETNIYIFYISKSESLDKYPCEMRCNTMYVDMLQIVFFHPITFFKLGYSFRQNIFFLQIINVFILFFLGFKIVHWYFFCYRKSFYFEGNGVFPIVLYIFLKYLLLSLQKNICAHL